MATKFGGLLSQGFGSRPLSLPEDEWGLLPVPPPPVVLDLGPEFYDLEPAPEPLAALPPIPERLSEPTREPVAQEPVATVEEPEERPRRRRPTVEVIEVDDAPPPPPPELREAPSVVLTPPTAAETMRNASAAARRARTSEEATAAANAEPVTRDRVREITADEERFQERLAALINVGRPLTAAQIMAAANNLSQNNFGGRYNNQVTPAEARQISTYLRSAYSHPEVRAGRASVPWISVDWSRPVESDEGDQAVRAATREDGTINRQLIEDPYLNRPLPALLANVAGGFRQQAGGAFAAIPEIVATVVSGATGTASVGQSIRQGMEPVAQWFRENGQAYADPGRMQRQIAQPFARGTPEYLVFNMATSLANMAPAVATGTPTMAASLIGAQVFGEEYDQNIERGLDPQRAAGVAALRAIAEFIPERMALGVAMNASGRLIPRTARGAGAEAAQEGVTQLINIGLDIGVFGRETNFTEALDEIAEAMVIGSGPGGAIAAATGGERGERVGRLAQALQQRGAIREMQAAQFAQTPDQVARNVSDPELRRGAVQPPRVDVELIQPERGQPRSPEPVATMDDLVKEGNEITGLSAPVATVEDVPEREQPRQQTREPADLRTGEPQRFLVMPGRITSRIGPRRAVRTRNGQMSSSNHPGVDIAAPEGTPIPSGADGVVVYAGPRGGYGNMVIIRHSDGTTSRYAHQSRIARGIEVGDRVQRGQTIGYVGQSGNATGPHLHLERRDAEGNTFDPLSGRPVRGNAEFEEDLDPAEVEYVEEEDPAPWEEEDPSNIEDIEAEEEAADNIWAEAVEEAPEQEPEIAAEPEQLGREGPAEDEVEEYEADEEGRPTGPLLGYRNERTGEFRPVEAAPEAAQEPVEAQEEAVRSPTAPEPQTRSTAVVEPSESGKQIIVRNASPEQVAAIREATGSTAVPRRDGSIALPPRHRDTVEAIIQSAPAAPQLPPEQAVAEPERGATPSPAPTAEANYAAADAAMSDESMVPLLSIMAEMEDKGRRAPIDNSTQRVVVAERRGFIEEGPDGALRTTAAGRALIGGAVATPTESFVASEIGKSQATTPEAPASSEIAKRAERYEEKLFDLETDGTKSGARAFAKRLVKDGVIPQSELDALEPIFKDRDMGVEDITSELRTSIQLWEEGQRASGMKLSVASAAPATTSPERRTDDQGTDRSAGGIQAPEEAGRGQGELRGEARLLDVATGAPALDAPLEGAPGPVTVPGRGKIQFAPYPPARRAAAAYMEQAGLPYDPATRYVPVDVERATRIAAAYEAMEDKPFDPQVRAAYDAMAAETLAQWETIKATGLQVEFIDVARGDPYEASPRLAHLDVIENNHLWVFRTDDGYGQTGITRMDELRNPLLKLVEGETISGKPVRVNDIFRIVHDYFGHFKDGNGFRAAGEENAWQSHAAMYSPLARRAMTTETRGQNSWVNYGPHGEANRTASGANTIFAEQKIGLLPEWVSEEGLESGRRLGRGGRDVGQDGRGRDEGAGADGRGGEPITSPPINPDGTITLDHWSVEPALRQTDPSFWGRAGRLLPEEERRNIGRAPDRTYFGIGTGLPGGYVNEFRKGTDALGRGQRHRYEARIPAERLYDMAGDPDGLKDKGRAMERLPNGNYAWPGQPDGVSSSALYELLIQDAGYAGYWIRRLGMVAAVFEPVPVRAHLSRAEREAKFRQIAAVTEEALDEVASMGLKGRRDFSLTVVGSIFGDEKIAGGYSREQFLVKIAAFNTPDARQTTRHEVMHWALDRVFNPAEAKILLNWAKNNKEMMAWARGFYTERGLTEDEIIEEALAEGFSRLTRAELGNMIERPTGAVAKLIERLADFFQKLWIALTAHGITRRDARIAAQFMLDLRTGDAAARADARRTPKVTLRQQLMTRELTPAEFMVRMAAPQMDPAQLAIAWHGSAADFDTFTIGSIGTGAGMQAFGWGLYFTDKRMMAEWYRQRLAAEKRPRIEEALTIDGAKFGSFTLGDDPGGTRAIIMAEFIEEWLTDNKGQTYPGWLDMVHGRIEKDYLGTIAVLERGKDEGPRSEASGKTINELQLETMRADLEWFDRAFAALRNRKVEYKGANAKVYMVEIPDTEKLLDLDEDVREQSAWVRDGLNKLKEYLATTKREGSNETLLDYVMSAMPSQEGSIFEDLTGEEIQQEMMGALFRIDGIPRLTPAMGEAIDNFDYPKAASLWLRELGILGNKHQAISGPASGDTTNYVIFDDEFINIIHKFSKTAARQTTLGDPTIPNPSLARRMAVAIVKPLDVIASGTTFEDSTLSAQEPLFAQLREAIDQKFIFIRRTEQRAAKLRGLSRLPEREDVTQKAAADERAYKLDLIHDQFVEPMVKIMAQNGLTKTDVGLYLYARHAPHRNARVAKINKEFDDPNDPLKAGSGMSDPEAQLIIDTFRATGQFDALDQIAQLHDAMMQWAQDERLRTGLLNSGDMANGFRPDEFYTPLRGNWELDPEHEVTLPTANGGGGFSVRGKESPQMKGRVSRADPDAILAQAIVQAGQAADRSWRNEVADAIYRMALNNPDPGFWRVDKVDRVAVRDKATGMVRYEMRTRLTPEEEERTVFVKVDGVLHKITFEATNPTAMRFVRAAKNLDVERLKGLTAAVAAYSRFFSRIYTQLNPDFVAMNMVRDMGTGVLNTLSVDERRFTRELAKNLGSFKAITHAFRGGFRKTGAGAGSSNPWIDTYERFRAAGGKIGFNQMAPLDSALTELDNEIKFANRSKVNPLRWGRATKKFVANLNDGAENVTRLAAFKAMIDLGVSDKEAARVARELTVNFTQHGRWGPRVNAWHAFANATTIGNARMAITLLKKPSVVIGLAAFGAIYDTLMAAFDDDWDEYSEEDKARWLILPTDSLLGWDISLPFPPGYNALVTVGRKMAELARGHVDRDGNRTTPWTAAVDAAWSLGAWSPVTGQSIWNFLSPTIGDTMVDVVRNETYFGNPVAPPSEYRRGPAAYDHFRTTPTYWVEIAQVLNSIGGNRVQSGPLDTSPDQLRYAMQQMFFGGPGKAIERLLNIATGENDQGLEGWPVIRGFVAAPTVGASQEAREVSLFYERYRAVKETVDEAKELRARGIPDYEAFRNENREVLTTFGNRAEGAERTPLQQIDRSMRRLSAAINAAEDATGGDGVLLTRDKARAIERGTRVEGREGTGLRFPVGRRLNDEQLNQVRERVDANRQRIARRFNERYEQSVVRREPRPQVAAGAR